MSSRGNVCYGVDLAECFCFTPIAGPFLGMLIASSFPPAAYRFIVIYICLLFLDIQACSLLSLI